MKALVYHGPGQRSWDTVPNPTLQLPTDAIVKIDTATFAAAICTFSRATCLR
jgi:hypothetical protein